MHYKDQGSRIKSPGTQPTVIYPHCKYFNQLDSHNIWTYRRQGECSSEDNYVQVSKQKNSTEPVFLQDINFRKNYWSCIESNIFSFQCSKYVYKHTMAIGVSETETDLTSKSFPKVWIFKRIALFLSVYCDSTSPYLSQLWHYLSALWHYKQKILSPSVNF